MSDNVIDLNEYRKRKEQAEQTKQFVQQLNSTNLQTKKDQHEYLTNIFSRQKFKQVPNNEGRVCIKVFNPELPDNAIIYALVYNTPSVLDSFYALYPHTVRVDRFNSQVVLRSIYTLETIITVEKHCGLWYSQVTANVDT